MIISKFRSALGRTTAGLNVDLGSFFELAELMIKLSKGTYGLLKIINQKTFELGPKEFCYLLSIFVDVTSL